LSALSRRREYAADRSSVEATDDPKSAVQALISLYSRSEVPGERSRVIGLFSSHPALWDRVDAIAGIGQLTPDYISSIRAALARTAALEEEK
jgi:Zn-dependent protease with chaperone function